MYTINNTISNDNAKKRKTRKFKNYASLHKESSYRAHRVRVVKKYFFDRGSLNAHLQYYVFQNISALSGFRQ